MHRRPPQPGYDNATRRNAGSSLDKLDDALSVLERRMGIEPADRRSVVARPPSEPDDDVAAIRARQALLDRRQSVAGAADGRLRGSGDGQVDAVLRNELTKMRETLNAELSSTIAGHFTDIRQELRRLETQQAGLSRDDVADGFDRLTRELSVVASRVENGEAGSLRSEVEELKAHVAALAREDTLRDMADRWSVIENEIGSLPQALGSREDLLAIADRITDISLVLHALPDTDTMHAMETQVRALAEAVEVLAAQNAAVSPTHLHTIEERLDEISRAIVSASVSAPPVELDPAPFERIEARLSALARQIEERSGGAQSETVEGKLAEIGTRLDALHAATAAVQPHDQIYEAIASRLEELTGHISSSRAAPAVSERVLENLDARFEEIAARLDSQRSDAQEAETRMFRSLDTRMAELARRIEDNEREAAPMPTFDHMERRIEEIAQMLSATEGMAPDRAPSEDLSLLQSSALQNIEAQIAELSQRLSATAPTSDNAMMAELAPRLMQISEHLANGRDDMIAAAREAAEEIAARLPAGSGGGDVAVLQRLTEDMRGLEEISRYSDDRNARTFEAIHDTLVSVADRIADLETGLGEHPAADVPQQRQPAVADAKPAMAVEAAPTVSPAAGDDMHEAEAPAAEKPLVADAPPVDMVADTLEALVADSKRREPQRKQISPAEAAVLAARAASEDSPPIADGGAGEAGQPARAKGLLGSLRSRLSRSASTQQGDEPDTPEIFGKAEARKPETVSDEEPLEPGSGGPDLAAIMRRVRAERAGEVSEGSHHVAEDDTGKSDFIAAARRAARAAASEVSVLDNRPQSAKPGKATLFKPSRRSLLLAAGAILLAIMSVPARPQHSGERPCQRGAAHRNRDRRPGGNAAADRDAGRPNARNTGNRRYGAEGARRRKRCDTDCRNPGGCACAHCRRRDDGETAGCDTDCRCARGGWFRGADPGRHPGSGRPAGAARSCSRRRCEGAVRRRRSHDGRRAGHAGQRCRVSGALVRNGGRTRLCPGAVSHRQFLREGFRRRTRPRHRQDVVPACRRAG